MFGLFKLAIFRESHYTAIYAVNITIRKITD